MLYSGSALEKSSEIILRCPEWALQKSREILSLRPGWALEKSHEMFNVFQILSASFVAAFPGEKSTDSLQTHQHGREVEMLIYM